MLHARRLVPFALVMAILAVGCVKPGGTPVASSTAPGAKKQASVIQISPGPKVQDETLAALIKAKPGDTIEFAAGTFEFTKGLSLAVENVTIRGKGKDKTILSFKKQDAGKEGLLVTRGKFLIEDLTVQDTKGDGIKVNEADGVTFRRVKAEWTGGPKETNGPYGLYPVLCKNVLIEDCAAIGASDAGIYVGQSQNIIVRRCHAERNVAGIEIENCIEADVYENMATNNAGGLLVFDLPGLKQKNGRRVRVFNNGVIGNNHENFAPKNALVAAVASGTGMMVMATDQVEVFQNTIKDNNTFSLGIWSFHITQRPLDDKQYDPYPEGIYVHDNKISGGGRKPAGDRGKMLALVLGEPLPDIIYDGFHDPAKFVNGKLRPEFGLRLKNNGAVTFANLHWDAVRALSVADFATAKTKVERDMKAYEGELAALPPVRLSGAP